jgi:hypothetical protein
MRYNSVRPIWDERCFCFDPHPRPILPLNGEGEEGEKMNPEIVAVEQQDAELQERVAVLIEDHARPAEQIINEQMIERDEGNGTSTPRFLP